MCLEEIKNLKTTSLEESDRNKKKNLPGTDEFTDDFLQIFQEGIMPIFLNSFGEREIL